MRAAPGPGDLIRFAPGFGPCFVVTVDTEEEFDWEKPFERYGHGLSHVPAIARFQTFCENAGVAPVYLVDYPVACDTRLNDVLGPAILHGRAEIGIQLHPWVNPPHDEEVNVRNSFAGNLAPELERAKFATLKRTIEQTFGRVPRCYRAGRYGLGPHTQAMLRDAGVTIDTSVRARFDYSHEGGPDYREHPVHPWWIDRAAGLIELPLTTVYCGVLRHMGNRLYHAASRIPRLRGVLARLGLLERVPLTPEGVDITAALRAIDVALADGLPVLMFSFHSPSLAPGNTPYVRDEAALERLYDWWRAVFAHLHARGVAPAGLADVIAAAQA
ncbi:polysaccharide deacetylase family protein [Novosphingobium sp.]|uniref:polysaccharide deacetylase family protein n=1 Tax=Novosphingobium sp. TaxID=1874826 RepID=UPI003D147A99